MDHAATTPVRKEVFLAMKPFFSKKFGNASSLHFFGREAKEAIENARQKIAKIISAQKEEIIFTSGGTESDNMAIKKVAFANMENGNHVITSKIEHPAVLESCKMLEKKGFKITYLDVDCFGIVNPKDVEKAITNKTILVSIMHANNEIGTIQKIEEIGKICKRKKVYFHTDAVQTFCKEQIDVKRMNIDLLSASSHKIYGPKGTGFLFVKKGTKISPLFHGGGHEFGLRSGTENVAGIVGFAKAAVLMHKEMKKENARLKKLRNKLIVGLLKMGARLNGHLKKRLANNVNVSFRGIEGESIILNLDKCGIAASTGSACSTRTLEPSHVLLALGLKPIDAHGSLRLTLGKQNKEKDVIYLLGKLEKIIKDLKRISPFK